MSCKHHKVDGIYHEDYCDIDYSPCLGTRSCRTDKETNEYSLYGGKANYLKYCYQLNINLNDFLKSTGLYQSEKRVEILKEIFKEVIDDFN